MPAAAIPAAIGAAGSIAGGVAGGKGAKKAARIQAQNAAQQRALFERLHNQTVGYFTPDMQRGDRASEHLEGLLGLKAGVDPTATLRATPGYQFRVNEAQDAINSNAFARGMGNSGAVQKALQKQRMGLADQTFNTHFAQVSTLADRGMSAKGALANSATNFGNQSAGAMQTAANAQSNAALMQAQMMQHMIQGLAGAAGSMFPARASTPSYSSSVAPASATTPSSPGFLQGMQGYSFNPFSTQRNPFGGGY